MKSACVGKDTVVVIPAFNEEASIGLVLDDIPMARVIRVIVVNNGSTDRTAMVARAHGALVVDEARKGYGQACLTGIAAAADYEPRNIAFLDGDYSDEPAELSSLLDALDRGAEMVIGSRTLGRAETGALLPQAVFGNWLATRLMRALFGGYRFTDLGPFRVIKHDKLQQLSMADTNFGWTVEMQAKALAYGLKCSEVSVTYRKRVGVSKITGTVKGTFMAGYKIIYTLFRLRFTLRKKLHT
ncbi:MAG: glycosyltransferase family 2 protein [Gammaproteobacteria bacterium]|nr:glycosyltransferase family 2 protein [Gammaproteobacteria bacterium]